MATPVRTQIGDRLKAVRDPMVDLLCIVILWREINKARAVERNDLPQYLIWIYIW